MRACKHIDRGDLSQPVALIAESESKNRRRFLRRSQNRADDRPTSGRTGAHELHDDDRTIQIFFFFRHVLFAVARGRVYNIIIVYTRDAASIPPPLVRVLLCQVRNAVADNITLVTYFAGTEKSSPH